MPALKGHCNETPLEYFFFFPIKKLFHEISKHLFVPYAHGIGKKRRFLL